MVEIWDTSALILAAREPTAGRDLTDALADDAVAVTEPIVLEYLNGARQLIEYEAFSVRLQAAKVITTTPEDWQRALSVHRALAASGPGHQRSVRLVDLIVAAVAERADLPIVHLDKDYERIAAITGQPIRRLVTTTS